MRQRLSTDFAYTPLTTRLGYYMGVPSADLAAIDDLVFEERSYERGAEVIGQGDAVRSAILITSGWSARARYTAQGARQIISILLPGDIATPDLFVIDRMDHAIVALSELTVRFLDKQMLQSFLVRAPELAAALWWATAQEDSIVREQVVRLGRRNAIERTAHFLLEVHRRLLVVQQATESAMIVPLTQNEIADALGLTNVSVSKTMSRLERARLIRRQRTVIQLLDIDGLVELSDFNTFYLHLNDRAEMGEGP